MRIKERVKEIDSWLADVLEEEQVEPQEQEEHLITEDHCTDTDTPKVLFCLFFLIIILEILIVFMFLFPKKCM